MATNEEIRDEDTIGIDIIDPVNIEPVEVSEDPKNDSAASGKIPSVKRATGKVVSLLFDIIAGLRGKEFWKLDESEQKSVDKICPEILPKSLTEHAGKIACVVTLLSMILKRIKLERALNEEIDEQINEQVVDNEKTLMGGRNG